MRGITTIKNDLNGNILRREYPAGVVELREFDALNRLSSITNLSAASAHSTVAYSHDAAGNLRQMTDSVFGLADVPQTAVYTWEYDDAYRLESEQVERASLPALRTEYDWDDAGNRLAKREYSGGALDRTITYSTPNNLNQMLGWSDGTTNAVYQFDANGARTNATLIAGGSTNTTAYTYDEDNRLIAVALDSTNATHSFAYDYRTRRYWRATPAETNLCVFDGGLTIQEYDASSNSIPEIANLQVEYLRGPDLGGGVGGMVYSIRADGIRCSHANHRGDVAARTGPAGQLAWFARYEAYGTRIDEAGHNPDRQMANTKDEEKDINLVNGGMRPRHLIDGVWLVRDPSGYADGPNLYAFVHANPVNAFDPTGLNTYLLTWATSGGGWGHSVFGVDNYDEDGNPDGTISYYSLTPDGEPNLLEGNKDFDATYTEKTSADKPQDYKYKREKPDGVVEFEGGSDMSQSAKDAMDSHKDNNPKFNGKKNNCTDYAKAGVKGATGKGIYAKERLVKANTPNKAFRETSKLPGAKVTKDPGKSVEKGFIRGSFGDAYKRTLGFETEQSDSVDPANGEAEGQTEGQTESTTENEEDN